MKSKIIIHGGAGKLEGNFDKANQIRESLLCILNESKLVLDKTNAREAVIFAVKLLEDESLFNAGTGSKLQEDGKARMSASIMDSSSNIFSAIINIENIKNPIEVASRLKEKNNTVLASENAINFARKLGFKVFDTKTNFRIEEFKSKKNGETGTVGAVAIDKKGMIAAATSTGGIGGEIPGRVSDSATVAGNYANKYAGVSCTGIGEHIMNFSLASKIVSKVEEKLDLQDVVKKIMLEAEELNYKFGIISIDCRGNVVVSKTTEMIYYAYDNGKRKELFDF
tara:strand:+ start:124 stop:969 length:846 start_codon:yes stop_codon:yes gene_type:complete